MKTPLDSGHTWFLSLLKYASDDRTLVIDVVEGFVADREESVEICGNVMEGLRAIAPETKSRHFRISFASYITWQVVDESYSAFDKTEERDDAGFVSVITRSKYLDYIEAKHGWYSTAEGPAKQYRIWTENEVVEVVTTGEVNVELLHSP